MDKELILDEAALGKLNRFTRTPVTAEQVYAFPVVLCDNEVDRDGERFSTAALEKLAELFVGKTYPWEVLDDIKPFILKLGETLSPEEFDHPEEGVWIAKDAKRASLTTTPKAPSRPPASSTARLSLTAIASPRQGSPTPTSTPRHI